MKKGGFHKFTFGDILISDLSILKKVLYKRGQIFFVKFQRLIEIAFFTSFIIGCGIFIYQITTLNEQVALFDEFYILIMYNFLMISMALMLALTNQLGQNTQILIPKYLISQRNFMLRIIFKIFFQIIPQAFFLVNFCFDVNSTSLD